MNKISDMTDDQAAVEWLARHDAPCPVCGYNLRAVPQAICPECAATLRLAIASPNLRLGAWLLAIISAALAVGFDGVAVTLAMAVSLRTGSLPPRPAWVLLGGLVLGALVCAGAIMGLLAGRRRWMQLSARRQWQIAVGAFILIGAAHGGFALWFFWR